MESEGQGRTKPLLRYPGGKFYALRLLRPFYQAIPHDEYREPFAGGATVFFDKPQSPKTWLNDVDQELMTLYRVLADARLRARLAKELAKEEATPERWQVVHRMPTRTPYEVAYKYYYLNRTSFSGKLSSASWGYRPKRSVPPERWPERLLPGGAKLEDAKLTCGDFEPVIRAPGDKVLLFVDPPYFRPGKTKHYRNGFDLEDHLRLAQTLRDTRHRFVLTYDDAPEIRRLYSWANVLDSKFTYRVDNSAMANGQRRTGVEVIISNVDVDLEVAHGEQAVVVA
jgi:DNA adenine methylase